MRVIKFVGANSYNRQVDMLVQSVFVLQTALLLGAIAFSNKTSQQGLLLLKSDIPTYIYIFVSNVYSFCKR